MIESILLSGLLLCVELDAPELCQLDMHQCINVCEKDESCAINCTAVVGEYWTKAEWESDWKD